MESNKISLEEFIKELSENSGGYKYLVTINHHREVEDTPQNQVADYVLVFDSFSEKDNTFYAKVTDADTEQHFTISTSNIETIRIENNPDGLFSEEECFKVFHLDMKSGDVVSVGIYEV